MRTYYIIFLFFFSSYFLVPHRALSFEYFDKSIDYWDLKETRKKSQSLHEPFKPKSSIQNPKASQEKRKFNWETYLNPKTTDDLKEVFREGDYTPPTPLLEVANNPTDENIKNWFKLIKKKNQFMAKLSNKMSDYLKRTSHLKPTERKFIEKQVSRQKDKIEPQSIDFKRFQFRMYFESSCPHCRQMMDELVKLQDMGFYIELRQIDDDKSYARGLPFIVHKASQAELKEKKIEAWPVLFVADQKKKVVYRINGFQKAEDILFTLQNK